MKHTPEMAELKRMDPLNACVHCGLCLNDCPTYKLTGDECNSPRGRLQIWQAEEQGRIGRDKWSDFYTDECLGCLACESACPSNVPYGDLLEQKRKTQSVERRIRINWKINLAVKAIRNLNFFSGMLMPMRFLRRFMGLQSGFIFPGKPSVVQSSADYAKQLVERHKPTGPTVALLTGCLMEAVFREINFATIRVLIQNNINVVIPPQQGCCGALNEHTGIEGVDELFRNNRAVFGAFKYDRVLCNSAGCGLTLSKALGENGILVQDVLTYLGEIGVKTRPKHTGKVKLYVDLPCHLIHGQKLEGIPKSVLDATGYAWELVPGARDCCGSGGTYNIQKPENSRRIIQQKSAFLDGLPPEVDPVLVTSNHVCMMQWNSAKKYVKRSFRVRHVIELLDSESQGE